MSALACYRQLHPTLRISTRLLVGTSLSGVLSTALKVSNLDAGTYASMREFQVTNEFQQEETMKIKPFMSSFDNSPNCHPVVK